MASNKSPVLDDDKPTTTTPARRPAVARRTLAVLVLLLIVGGGLRLVRLNDPPMNFYPGRQYDTELVTRWYYVDTGGQVAGVSPEVAEKSAPGLIEPPILQITSAAIDHVIGHESLLVPLVISVLAWLAGAVFLFLLVRRLLEDTAALVSVAVFLFLPIAVFGSRVIQPDPLLVAATIAALLAIVRHDDQPSARRLAMAAVVSAVAVFIKLPAIFFVVPVFAVLLVRREGWKPRAWRDGLVFLVVTALPAFLYLVAGYVIWGFLRGQETGRFLPQLWVTGDLWSGWLASLVALFAPTLYLGIAGVVLATGRTRAVLFTLLAGYLAYGLFFPHHITSHTYYQLPFIPVLALAVGALVERGRQWSAGRPEPALRRYTSPLLISAVALAILLSNAPLVADPPSDVALHWIDISAAAGEATGHSTRVLMVAPADGDIFRFYGGVAGLVWPTSVDLDFQAQMNAAPMSVPARFDAMRSSLSADYLVVTWLDEWQRQPELRALVESHYPLVASGDGYLVYDLRRGHD